MIRTLLLFLLSVQIVSADELGRLFFTPAQRHQLETSTNHRGATTPAPITLELNGIVEGPHGKRTIWVNGVASIKDINGQTTDRQMLRLPDASSDITLKVGEKIVLPHSSMD